MVPQLPPQDLKHLIPGYPKLAGNMGLIPEMALFRTFSTLNAQNLLYLQAELIGLEKQLRKCEEEDHNSNEEKRRLYAKDWEWLELSQVEDTDISSAENEVIARQYKIFKKIRAKLTEYNHAMIQASVLAQMRPPDASDIASLKYLLLTKEMGSLSLVGDDCLTWGEWGNPKSHSLDLAALRPRQTEDSFSMWVAEHGLSGLKLFGSSMWKKKSRIHGEISLEDSTVFRFTSWVTSIVASMIPIASILVLYTVNSMKARLGIIAAFNILISVCVSTFTKAKRAEVFTIAAAFAAVQVVFVGVDNTPNSFYRAGNSNLVSGNGSLPLNL